MEVILAEPCCRCSDASTYLDLVSVRRAPYTRQRPPPRLRARPGKRPQFKSPDDVAITIPFDV